MPTYEMTILFKSLPKEELFTAVKKAGSAVLAQGGILRKLDGLGINIPLPYKMKSRGQTYREGSYFLYTFDLPTSGVANLTAQNKYEVDIIKSTVCTIKQPVTQTCHLEEELQPAPYRKPVQDIVADQERKKRVRFPLNTGLDYNPLP